MLTSFYVYRVDGASKAIKGIHNRLYSGKTVVVKFFPLEDFQNRNLGPKE